MYRALDRQASICVSEVRSLYLINPCILTSPPLSISENCGIAYCVCKLSCCFSYQVRHLNEQLEFSYYKGFAYCTIFHTHCTNATKCVATTQDVDMGEAFHWRILVAHSTSYSALQFLLQLLNYIFQTLKSAAQGIQYKI